MKDLSFSIVPRNWAICFHTDCPQSDTCLRRAAAKMAPAHLTRHNTVLPAARQGDRCSLFVSSEPVLMASGMDALFRDVNPWQAAQIRKRLFDLFGCKATYYRYNTERRDITPEMQERIIAVFREFGCNGELKFNNVTEKYNFKD